MKLSFYKPKHIVSNKVTTFQMYVVPFADVSFLSLDIVKILRKKYHFVIFEVSRKSKKYTKVGFKVSATTKCSNEDTYDAIKGKHIAENKCKIKAYKTALNILYDINKEYEKTFGYSVELFPYYKKYLLDLLDEEIKYLENQKNS